LNVFFDLTVQLLKGISSHFRADEDGKVNHNPIGGMLGGFQDAIIARREAASAPRVYDAVKTDRLLAELRAERDVAIARQKGASAQVLALRDALNTIAPNHALLQITNQKYKAGKLKSRLRLIWEAAFDKSLNDTGSIMGNNPTAYRD
jgi:hypothetical protein